VNKLSVQSNGAPSRQWMANEMNATSSRLRELEPLLAIPCNSFDGTVAWRELIELCVRIADLHRGELHE
jgi:hypothetical protein